MRKVHIRDLSRRILFIEFGEQQSSYEKGIYPDILEGTADQLLKL